METGKQTASVEIVGDTDADHFQIEPP